MTRAIFLTTLVFLTSSLSIIGQSTKFQFDIDGTRFLSIKQNAGGFNIIDQNNLQTSMFFGFNSGLHTINDPSVFGSGDNNTSFGFATLSSNTTGKQNTAIGSGALDNNLTGSTNTAIGFGALKSGESASDNVGIGKSTLLSNVSGSFNVAIGNDAFNNTNTANRSVAIGNTAGVNDSSSVDNVYVGFGAGRGTVFATDGYDRSNNVMIGSLAGYSCETNGNVFLGFEAGRNSKAANQLYITNSDTDSLNSLIYGQFDNDLLRINGEVNIDGLYTLPSSAPSSGDVLQYTGGSTLTWGIPSQLWEEGSGTDVLYENGDVGIGLSNAFYRLDVQDNVNNGYVARFRNQNTTSASNGIIIQTGPSVNPSSSSYYALLLDGNGTNLGGIRGNGSGGLMYSSVSDQRLKQNINTFNKGLETLDKIIPTIYQMKSNPGQDEIGFIAQDLKKVLPHMVGGEPTDNVEESPMTVDYGRITPVLVAAIKEQLELINALSKRLDKQEKEIKLLKAEAKK